MSEARDAAIAATEDPADLFIDYSGPDGNDVVNWTLPAWSSDLSEIPFDIEVTVAWNFTNSTHTKSIVIRHSDTPGILWLDNLQHQFITIEDARYWIGYPDLPADSSTQPVMFACGYEEDNGSYGMWAGPNPSLQEMLSYTPGNDSDGRKAVIVKFENGEDTVIRVWSRQLSAWVGV